MKKNYNMPLIELVDTCKEDICTISANGTGTPDNIDKINWSDIIG